MKPFAVTDIRNVVLLGHSGAGKTSLVESLLFRSGATSRLGRVDDGTATTDFEPEETRRHLSVSLALAPVEHGHCKLNLLDAPGYLDFAFDVETALAVADLAVIVVSAVDGVQVGTELAFERAVAAGVPRLFFVNKLDRERASFERVLGELRESFGSGIAPLELPLGEEAHFRGVADLLDDVAVVYDAQPAGRPTSHHEEIPSDIADREHQVREALVEGIVVADDRLLERYLEGDLPSPAELEEALAIGVRAATVTPVLCGSAVTGVGVDRLADLVCELGPSPAQRPPLVAHGPDGATDIPPDPAGPPLAWAFRTFADPYVGRITLLKVASGTLRPDSVLLNARTHAEERLHSLFALRGKEQLPVEAAGAGDLVATSRLSDVLTGDTLAPRGTPVTLRRLTPPPPVLTVAVVPHAKGDEDKLSTGLHRLTEEDPTLVVSRSEETSQLLLAGSGETHLAIVIERLKRKFGVEVTTEEVRVPYRETITAPAEAEGRHKKQTGGHGQYAVVNLRIAPLPRGEGYRFVDAVVGGAIPRQFIPAVDKGVQETMAHGVTWGYPLVDIEVTCYDGKFHPVDSSELAFKTAAALALREAVAHAGPVLLEPIAQLIVRVPAALQGDVLGDLTARRGRVVRTAAIGDRAEIEALVPESELLRYAVDLRSLTGGRGHFELRRDHYDVAQLQRSGAPTA